MQAFLSNNEKEVVNYIKELRKTRESQNSEIDRLMPDVIEQCEEQIDNKMIVAYIDTPYGIGGLLGNKLLEKYQRPILILKDCGDKYSGSMRAVGVDDFRQMILDSGLATSEGHELAAGVDIPKENIEKFTAYIEEELSNIEPSTSIRADIQIDVNDITRSLINRIKALDRISGTGFEPIKIYVNGITSYDVSNFSNYKHLVIKPKDYLLLIKWNWNGSFDEMEDNSIVEEELEIVATLDSGWLGRSFVLKAICDEINVRSD
jgi:single-stranded-DNA-specific exonuclease